MGYRSDMGQIHGVAAAQEAATATGGHYILNSVDSIERGVKHDIMIMERSVYDCI